MNRLATVMAFPMKESFGTKSFKNQLSTIVLGDVVISVERAKVQARKFSHSFYEELALLIIHGVLHLIGYDDIKKKDTLIMRRKEQEILKTIKFTTPIVLSLDKTKHGGRQKHKGKKTRKIS